MIGRQDVFVPALLLSILAPLLLPSSSVALSYFVLAKVYRLGGETDSAIR